MARPLAVTMQFKVGQCVSPAHQRKLHDAIVTEKFLLLFSDLSRSGFYLEV